MKYLILMPLLAVLCFYGCKDDAPTPKERIVGTWVGVEYPEIDTAFFHETDTVRFTGNLGISYQSYIIDYEKLLFFNDSGDTSSHEYVFKGNSLAIKSFYPFAPSPARDVELFKVR